MNWYSNNPKWLPSYCHRHHPNKFKRKYKCNLSEHIQKPNRMMKGKVKFSLHFWHSKEQQAATAPCENHACKNRYFMNFIYALRLLKFAPIRIVCGVCVNLSDGKKAFKFTHWHIDINRYCHWQRSYGIYLGLLAEKHVEFFSEKHITRLLPFIFFFLSFYCAHQLITC